MLVGSVLFLLPEPRDEAFGGDLRLGEPHHVLRPIVLELYEEVSFFAYHFFGNQLLHLIVGVGGQKLNRFLSERGFDGRAQMPWVHYRPDLFEVSRKSDADGVIVVDDFFHRIGSEVLVLEFLERSGCM